MHGSESSKGFIKTASHTLSPVSPGAGRVASTSARLWRGAVPRLVAAALCVLFVADVTADDELFSGGNTQNLIPSQVVHWAIMRNAEARSAGLRRDAVSNLVDAERALYDPVVSARLRQDYSDAPRSEDDTATFFGVNVGGTRTTERRLVAETGVSVKVPSGGEVQLLYRMQKRRVISGSNTNEYRGTVNITFQQPLLRGFGQSITEAELRVAEIDHQIESLRYQDQILKVAAEAGNTYWQLYRAHKGLEMRQAALDNAHKALRDVALRVEGGWAPATDLTEARIAVASREADVARAARLLEETRSALMSLLNVRASLDGPVFVPTVSPDVLDVSDKSIDARLSHATTSLPSLLVADSRVAQERIRLEVAEDRKRPDLRLELGYNRNSLDGRSGRAFEKSLRDDFDGWYAGLVFERPLGNQRASSSWEAQVLRLQQSQVDVEGLRTHIHNDVLTRWHQMESARREVELHQTDVRLREQLLNAEREQYEVGRVRLGRVFEREDELMQTRQNLLDSLTRFELARVALDFADGSLLQKHEVFFDGASEGSGMDVSQAPVMNGRQND